MNQKIMRTPYGHKSQNAAYKINFGLPHRLFSSYNAEERSISFPIAKAIVKGLIKPFDKNRPVICNIVIGQMDYFISDQIRFQGDRFDKSSILLYAE